jgi:hypothetical protein
VIQRLIGVSIGALITFVILWFGDFTNQADMVPWYAAAAIIGAIASFFWPVVIGFWLRGRAMDRREDDIQREVDRRMADQDK